MNFNPLLFNYQFVIRTLKNTEININVFSKMLTDFIEEKNSIVTQCLFTRSNFENGFYS